MPKRKVLQTIILTRKNDAGVNETVKPAIGTEFMFTQAELDQLNKLNPDALGKIITKDDAAGNDAQTVTLTAAELEQQKQDALNAQRDQMEKDIRAQLEKEAAAKAETDAKTEADAKTAKGKGKGKDDATNTDDDI